MRRHLLTVTRKVAAGYLLIVCFGLVAIVYALDVLHTQTARSRQLVAVDARSLDLARNLRQNLLAQESLQKQFLILRDPAFLPLLDRRRDELDDLWDSLAALPLPSFLAQVAPLMEDYHRENSACRDALASGGQPPAPACSAALEPLREELVTALDDFVVGRQQAMDQALAVFSRDSARAYRVTLLLAFLGIGLSAPAAVAIVLGIHRSVQALTEATRQIAAGSFDQPLPIAERRDEFGLLAREFRAMGFKLRELEQRCLDAHPLTHLPGNLAIDRELERRLRVGLPFAHLYLDLDDFKVYNDRYGYRAGSEVIARLAGLLRETVKAMGAPDDLVGHIGGDDFVVITGVEKAEPMAQTVIERFGRMVPEFYTEEDRQAGFFLARNRFGESRRFPLLTLSIAIVCSDRLEDLSPPAVSRACVKLKEYLKALPGSNYLIDRRRPP